MSNIDCQKLDINDCQNPKYDNKCKIKYSSFGAKDKCVKNKYFDLEKSLALQGIKNFNRLDEYNIEKDIEKRKQLCSSYSLKDCNSIEAKNLGCLQSKGFLGIKKCSLAKEIIDYYYRIDKKCLEEKCQLEKITGSVFCEKHKKEFKSVLESLNNAFNKVNKGKNIEDGYQNFYDCYKKILKDFYTYLIEEEKIFIDITEKYNIVLEIIGDLTCQCINIGSCVTKGKVGDFCRNRGFNSKYGLMCKIHKNCYIDRLKKFEKFENSFLQICKVNNCKKQLSELENFYKMIIFTTKGEAIITKKKLIEHLFILRQYIKENYSNN